MHPSRLAAGPWKCRRRCHTGRLANATVQRVAEAGTAETPAPARAAKRMVCLLTSHTLGRGQQRSSDGPDAGGRRTSEVMVHVTLLDPASRYAKVRGTFMGNFETSAMDPTGLAGRELYCNQPIAGRPDMTRVISLAHQKLHHRRGRPAQPRGRRMTRSTCELTLRDQATGELVPGRITARAARPGGRTVRSITL